MPPPPPPPQMMTQWKNILEYLFHFVPVLLFPTELPGIYLRGIILITNKLKCLKIQE
jgi:hypothetical protein